MADQIQLRRDSAANWTTTNPTLAQGEIGIELVTGKIKIGDGSTAWNSLDYFGESGTVIPTQITVADTEDTTAFVGLWESATGDQGPKTDEQLTYNAATGVLTAVGLTLAGALSGVSSIDSTTESTIEAAIDTLVNLTSVQGRTLTFSDANLDVIFGWDDSAAAYKSLLLADILTEAAPAAGDFVLIYGAEGDLRKVDWAGVGSGGVPTQITVADTEDTTAFVALFDSATGDLGPKTDEQLTYNAATGLLTAVALTLSGALSGVSSIDSTTESTIEAAIDTLANLTSIQSQAISLSAPFTLGADPNADRILFWDDSDGGTRYLAPGNSLAITTTTLDTIQDIRTSASPTFASLSLTGTLDGFTVLGATAESTIEAAIDTLANLTSIQGRTVTLSDAGFDVLAGWDDSANAYKNFLLADITAEATPATGDFLLIYGAEGDLRKVNWSGLPGGSSFWAAGVPANSIYYSAGYVGIGTDTPTANLSIATTGEVIALNIDGDGGTAMLGDLEGYIALFMETPDSFMYLGTSGATIQNTDHGFELLFASDATQLRFVTKGTFVGTAGFLLRIHEDHASQVSAGFTLADTTCTLDSDVAIVLTSPSVIVSDIAGTGTRMVESSSTGELSATKIVTSGTYTPTRSVEANLDANVTMAEAQYLRVGSTVTVSGRFTADPTTTTLTTSFEITLPIASNIGAVEDVAGVAFCGSIASQGAEVIGVVANDTAKIQWKAVDVTSQSWSYTFTYQII